MSDIKPTISGLRIKVRSFDHKVIDQAAKTILDAAQRTGAKTRGPVPLPTDMKKFTILKSTFVHKDARAQYEMRTHKRLIDIVDFTPKTIEMLSSLNLPAGVEVEIKQFSS